MGDLSPHFSRHEFACRCGCGFDDVSPELIRILEQARTDFSAPVLINSACRCAQHNRAIGGASASQHLFGTAADIVIKGVPPAQVADYFEGRYPDKYGIGRYKSFTHVDVRSQRARWA